MRYNFKIGYGGTRAALVRMNNTGFFRFNYIVHLQQLVS